MTQEWFDPNLFTLGPLQARWFGVLIILAWGLASLILRMFSARKVFPLTRDSINPFLFILLISAYVGARAMYVLLYHPELYDENLWDVFAVWKGGLSFHGGALAVGLMTLVISRVKKVSFFQLTDALIIAVSPGIFLGRLGNYINGELYGRVTDSWVGIVFPNGGPFPRHPSQLYEAFLEGLLLFFAGLFFLKRQKFSGQLTAGYVASLAILRFFIEFVREPDIQLGYLKTYFTMGQVLCLMMLPIAFACFKAAKLSSSAPSQNPSPSRP
jgi:phosphatidylglycerol---prolipoprotein diacylglyceryl transferase